MRRFIVQISVVVLLSLLCFSGELSLRNIAGVLTICLVALSFRLWEYTHCWGDIRFYIGTFVILTPPFILLTILTVLTWSPYSAHYWARGITVVIGLIALSLTYILEPWSIKGLSDRRWVIQKNYRIYFWFLKNQEKYNPNPRKGVSWRFVLQIFSVSGFVALGLTRGISANGILFITGGILLALSVRASGSFYKPYWSLTRSIITWIFTHFISLGLMWPLLVQISMVDRVRGNIVWFGIILTALPLFYAEKLPFWSTRHLRCKYQLKIKRLLRVTKKSA